MLLTLDGTFFIQMFNFIVFWMLLNIVFIEPTRRAIEARLRHIKQQYDESNEYKRRADSVVAHAEDILAQARRETDRFMRGAAADASAQVHAIEGKSAEEAGAIIRLAQATVASERAQTESDVTPFVDRLARDMLDRAVGFTKVV